MTGRSIQEYAAALRERYTAATKAERGRLLTEFCQTTGYHRKAAIRLLRQRQQLPVARRGRPKQYGASVVAALEQVWEASDCICGKRLAPFLQELVDALERHGELQVGAEVRTALLGLSAASIDRLLQPARQRHPHRPYTQSAATAGLKAQIPLRTFGEWDGCGPGAAQLDLVAHCGETTAGFYLTTLTLVDVATGWTECRAVWGKGQLRVRGAVHAARQALPVPLQELHTDNGGEFINAVLLPYCRHAGIRFTRGRPYKKNDQAFVEQKNWSVVRRLVGYDRYASKAAYTQLAKLYKLVRWYVNFFQPLRKLVAKERVRAKVIKRYDVARTPYQRLLAAKILDEAQQRSLAEQYERLNPLRLRQQIDAALAALWQLADPDDRRQPPPRAAGSRTRQ